MPTIAANGLQIAYETAGDPSATPVLLIMGLGMQLTAWPAAFVEGLVEQGAYVIRFDNRDSGLSSKLDHLGKPNLALALLKKMVGWRLASVYTLDDMANDALGLLDALGIAKAHVIGASMGGMIAQLLVGRHPERALSLTSIMSTSGRRSLPGPSRAATAALLKRPRDPRDLTAQIDAMVHTMRVIGSPAYPTPEVRLRSQISASFARNVCPAGVLRQMLAIAAAPDRVALLQSIRLPTLVIHGADDPLVPPACGIDTAQLVPDATLKVIEGMGHDLPDALIERLLALIDVHTHGKMAALSISLYVGHP